MRYFDFGDFVSCCKWVVNNELGKFEKYFAQYLGVKYAIGTSFGRTALFVGLKAIDVKNFEIILPAFCCTVVRHAVSLAGAKPVFVEVNFDTFDYDLKDLQKKINKKTRAIILTHYFGRVSSNINQIIKLTKTHNVKLIEDCAHSLGAEYNGKKIGTFGDISIFSLTKNMLNFGGGVLVTSNQEIYEKARSILAMDKTSFKKRVVDFPLIISYGFEQIIDKLLIDRIGRYQFKWYLLAVPQILVKLRSKAIYLLQLLVGRKNQNEIILKKNNKIGNIDKEEQPYNQGIRMEPIIASFAINQLKKIEKLNIQRNKISRRMKRINFSHFNCEENRINVKDVSTYYIFRFENSDLFKTIRKYKKDGISLRPTWPTHQRIWENQDTTNLRRIEDQILTLTINPNLKYTEIREILNTIGTQNIL